MPYALWLAPTGQAVGCREQVGRKELLVNINLQRLRDRRLFELVHGGLRLGSSTAEEPKGLERKPSLVFAKESLALTVSKGTTPGTFIVDAVLKATHFRVLRPVCQPHSTGLTDYNALLPLTGCR